MVAALDSGPVAGRFLRGLATGAVSAVSAVAVVALVLALPSRSAHAEPLPSGTLGIATGPISGTGADAKRLGAGFQYGGHAAWQPMSTDRVWGYSFKWATMFGRTYGGNAAQIDTSLQTVQMDLLAGLRFRPWKTPTRYLTARAGAGLMRANEPIPISSEPGAIMQRAFTGGVATFGLDQYIYNLMVNVDVRYGFIGNGPTQLALIIGVGLTGP
jgi:hypothetical protein